MSSRKFFKEIFPGYGFPSTREELIGYRDYQLRRLINYAISNVPYYRRVLGEAGLTHDDVRTISDLSRVPLTTKDDLREAGLEAVSKRVVTSRVLEKFTTGTTGNPLLIRRTIREQLIAGQFWRRCLRYYGHRPGDHLAVISIYPFRSAALEPVRGLRRFAKFIMHNRRTHLDCRQDPSDILETLKRIRPEILIGYAGILALLGEEACEKGTGGWSPRFILSGSETLSASRRERIQQGFGVPVYDYYSTYEGGILAWECRDTGFYHIAEDHIVAETLSNGRLSERSDREQGEIIITNLHNFCMPFVRYRLGDYITWGPCTCPCGAPFSTLRGIEGRWMDHFILPSGKRIHPMKIYTGLHEFKDIGLQVQFEQVTPDNIILRIVPSGRLTEGMLDDIRRTIIECLSEPVRVDVEIVERIDPEPTGKYKIFKSRTAEDTAVTS